MSFSEENNPGGYSPLKMTALLAALVEAFVPEYAKIKGIGTRIWLHEMTTDKTQNEFKCHREQTSDQNLKYTLYTLGKNQ